MDKKYIKSANDIENDVNTLIKNSGLKSQRNNLNKHGLIDLITEGELIDVQFSKNYEKYGDVRIDLFSAFRFKKDILENSILDQKGNYKKGAIFNITKEILNKSKNMNREKYKGISDVMKKFYIEPSFKYGKYTDIDNNMLGVIYYLYNDSEIEDKFNPDKILFVSKNTILDILKENKHNFENFWNIKNFKINDKKSNKLSDNFESAFIALNIKFLCKKYSNGVKLYDSKNDFKMNFKNDFYEIKRQRDEAKKKLHDIEQKEPYRWASTQITNKIEQNEEPYRWRSTTSKPKQKNYKP